MSNGRFWAFGRLLAAVLAVCGGLAACGGDDSASAPVTSQPSAVAPTISTQPVAASVAVGKTATFSVTAGGTAPLTYQWQKNAVAIAGATAATYSTPATVATDSGAKFTVVVSNTAGTVTSSAATLTVTSPAAAPAITTQPANQSVAVGGSATFTVAASGTAPLTYQWLKNAVAISGATAASYATPAAVATDSGASFTVMVTNAAGHVTSTAATLTVTTPVAAGNDVLTYKYDALRSGQNTHESTLTLTNVASSTFGLLHNVTLDGKVDAQPLYVSKLTIAGAVHNTVVAATEHDSVYAIDSGTGAILWHVSLLGSGETTSDDRSCGQIDPEIGITSTPVIDRGAGVHGTVFVVAMSKDTSSNYHQRLHALDLTTGSELLGGPVEIAATYPTATPGTSTTFAAGDYEERAALLLSNGMIYTSWTSHCDHHPYTGWIIAYAESSRARGAILNVAPNSGGVGPAIWMSGGGPAADSAGNVYLLTANGAFETTLDSSGFPSGQDYGNSFLKLATAGGTLTVADYFTVTDTVSASANDVDLGSGGGMLLPDLKDSANAVHHLMVGAGKDGNLYVVDRDNLGKFSPTANNIYQQLTGALPGGVWSTPAYFNGAIYYGSVGATLKAFPVTNAKLSAALPSQSSETFTYPGTAPSVSANGTANGIVWAHENSSPGVLHAFDAGNLAHELYNSNQAAAGRDTFGAGNKYITPIVSDGKVFVGTPTGVAIFGLLH